jgi:hypothetical protein
LTIDDVTRRPAILSSATFMFDSANSPSSFDVPAGSDASAVASGA